MLRSLPLSHLTLWHQEPHSFPPTPCHKSITLLTRQFQLLQNKSLLSKMKSALFNHWHHLIMEVKHERGVGPWALPEDTLCLSHTPFLLIQEDTAGSPTRTGLSTLYPMYSQCLAHREVLCPFLAFLLAFFDYYYTCPVRRLLQLNEMFYFLNSISFFLKHKDRSCAL